MRSSKTFFNSSSSDVKINSSLQRKQCAENISELSYFKRDSKPFMELTIDGAPSLQMPTQTL